MAAHIYIRVSTDDQLEGYSLHAQERACRLYCELHEITIAGLYCDEGLSGTSATRPQFVALLQNVQPGDVVLVHKLDRFTRNTRLLLDSLEQLDKIGARLVSVSEQLDFASPIGRVFVTLLGAFAQYYVDNLRSETAKGHREKARRGLWVGPVPVGYRAERPGYLVPSEDAGTIRYIYQCYADGMSYRQIVELLNAQGATTFDWRSKERRPWSRESVRVVLRNRAYAGYVSAGGQQQPGIHAPLVSEEQWAIVEQRRRALVRERRPGAPKGRYVLHCGDCGQRLWFAYGGRNLASSCYRCRHEHVRIDAPTIESQLDSLLSMLNVCSISDIAEHVYIHADGSLAVRPVAQYARLLDALGIETATPKGG